MLDVSSEIAVLLLFGTLLLLLFLGLPVSFALGGVAVLGMVLIWGAKTLGILATSAWAVMDFYTLIAVPLFIFMAMILKAAGIADDLFTTVRLWFGRVPCGLAIGVVFICTILAAMTGISGTGVITMGILALPVMLKLNYNKTIAIGPILAGGALGFLIPPSISFIVYGALTEVSIGKLFLGGVFPGLILSFLYVSYILIRGRFQPELGPPLPPEERGTMVQKIISLRSLLLPGALIMAVLGTIFMGIASPTEAASAGAAGAIACSAINRRFNWPMIWDACYETFRITGMVMWIMIGAYAFKAVFVGIGGPEFARNLVLGLEVNPLFVIAMMQLSYMFLGCFLEEMAIMMITIPAFVPIVTALGFSKVWFGVLFLVNMQMAYLTPPFGFCLFYLRGVAPPGVSLADIYRSILPFIPLQLTCLILLLFFPQIALWLPSVITF
jgi:tripartite ATP-independent transporter DctM subunit